MRRRLRDWWTCRLIGLTCWLLDHSDDDMLDFIEATVRLEQALRDERRGR